MSDVHVAARVDDPIAHSYKKAADIIGASTAIGVGLALTLLTAGTGTIGLAVVIKGLSEGAGMIGVGTWLASFGSDAIGKDEDAGIIQKGAKRTWTESKLAARITDPLKCADPTGTQAIILIFGAFNPIAHVFNAISNIESALAGGQMGEHPGKRVADGSKTVFIESRNAARVEDGTECGGSICKGAKRTWIGGARVALEGTKDRPEEGVALSWTLWLTERIGQIPGIIVDLPEKLLDAGLNTLKLVLNSIGDANPDLKPYTDWGQRAVDVVSRINDGKELLDTRGEGKLKPRAGGTAGKVIVTLLEIVKTGTEVPPKQPTDFVYYPP